MDVAVGAKVEVGGSGVWVVVFVTVGGKGVPVKLIAVWFPHAEMTPNIKSGMKWMIFLMDASLFLMKNITNQTLKHKCRWSLRDFISLT
jgi:hypothetical protein